MSTPIALRKRIQTGLLIVGLLGASLVAALPQAHAATMTSASVIEYNMNASQTSAFAVRFTAGASDAPGTLSINFGSWSGTVNTVQTVATTGCQSVTGATNPLPGTLTAVGAGQVVSVAGVTALTAGQSYCVVLTSNTAVTNPATTGSYPVILNDNGDTVTVAIAVITNNQVTVSATVPPSFTMSLSSNTDTLGNLSASSVTSSTGVTTTISTNGNYGWYLLAQDTQAGLRSASQSKTIPSVALGANANMSSNIGTESYALGVTTGNAKPFYADAGGTTGGGLSTTAFNQIAFGTAAVSGATITTKSLATISATTPAGSDYSDIISLVGAGSF